MSSAANLITPDLSQSLNIVDVKQNTASQLDLMPTKGVNPIYKYRTLYSVNQGQSFALSAGTTQTIINIPGDLVINLAKSYVSFDAQLPAVAVNNTLDTVWCDNIPIDQIVLQTTTGQVLANIQNAQQYLKVEPFLTTSLDEYKSRDPCLLGTAGVSGAVGTLQQAIDMGCRSINQGCQPCKSDLSKQAALYGAAAGPVTDVQPDYTVLTTGKTTVVAADNTARTLGAAVPTYIDDNKAADGNIPSDRRGYLGLYSNAVAVLNDTTTGYEFKYATGDTQPNVRVFWQEQPGATDTSGPSDNADSPQRITSGGPGGLNNAYPAVAVAQTLGLGAVRYRLNLKALSGTILALDKDLYFNQNLQLIIYYAAVDKWGFTSQDNPANSAACAAFAAVTLQNHALWLANDVNNATANALRSTVLSEGVKMYIPYVNSSYYNMAAGTGGQTFSTSTNLTPGMFKVVKRILTIPMRQNGTVSSTCNNVNVKSLKWRSVQSNINGKPLQDQPLNNDNSEPFNYLYETIRDSPAGISNRNYEISSFFVDNMSDCLKSKDWPKHDNEDSGLQIDQSMTYNMNWVIGTGYLGALSFYQYVVGIRKLEINATGIAIY